VSGCEAHDIQDVKITKDMLDLAKHIVEQKSGHFEPERFEDHYETALAELLAKKQKGLPIEAVKRLAPGNVVNLMDALRQSLASDNTAKPAEAQQTAKTPLPPEESGREETQGELRGITFAEMLLLFGFTLCVFLLRFFHRSFWSVLRSDQRP
jgi:hypothetical protein